MKEYPSIDRKPRYGIPIYMFSKLDGSNIRAEWSRKKSFYKFGSRHVLLGEDNPFIGEAISLIRESFQEPLNKIFTDEKYENTVAFFEFWGQNSFAGQHAQEEHFTSLIDVSPYKKGILSSNEYLKLFSALNIAPLLYHGNFNKEIEQKIKESSLQGMPFEGVVCKGIKEKASHPPIMFKVKSNAWSDKLKSYCKGDEKLYQKLM